jgi:hypothetical protein
MELKMNINKKIGLNFLLAGVLVLMLCSIVSAVGVSFPYSSDNPLTVYPGESKDAIISLDSGGADAMVRAELIESGGVASITDSSLDYTAGSGVSNRAKVNIRVTAPSTAAIGQEYTITIKFKDLAGGSGGAGTTVLDTATTISFKAVVAEKPADEEPPEEPAEISTMWIVIVLAVIIVLIVIVWLIASRRKKEGINPSEKPVK